MRSFGLIEERFETVRVAHVERQANGPRTQLGGDCGDPLPSMSPMTTDMPSRRQASAVARPMPRAPPVMATR